MIEERKVSQLKIGEYDVTIESQANLETRPPGVDVTAKCGDSIIRKTWMPFPRVNRDADNFRKGYQVFVEGLAEEVAGHERSRALLTGFFGS